MYAIELARAMASLDDPLTQPVPPNLRHALLARVAGLAVVGLALLLRVQVRMRRALTRVEIDYSGQEAGVRNEGVSG